MDKKDHSWVVIIPFIVYFCDYDQVITHHTSQFLWCL